jgi:hypothetical protein
VPPAAGARRAVSEFIGREKRSLVVTIGAVNTAFLAVAVVSAFASIAPPTCRAGADDGAAGGNKTARCRV